ncbi:pilus assembly protein [Alginatibacterium sediminis]|uniref:Pilus assembly protein n=1 Tax=Alginatibacterium sediminis TaxID=2164068 RepID=A0A420ECN4_9ALTE|nr:PilC/PilY family type IV pilus protein [Alginatibacterium sediminis]RKF18425.1 pilus assembly protein [Alginatibacterium sediminis]
MNIRKMKRIKWLLFSFLYSFGSVQAAVDIAKSPLFLAQGVDPNIMLVWDDSGSMQEEMMPNTVERKFGGKRIHFIFPTTVANIYLASNKGSHIITYHPDDIRNIYSRSPHNNKIYYDPEAYYPPWIKADGTIYPNAPATAAPTNPENSSAGTRNLTSLNSASGVDGVYNKDSEAGFGGTTDIGYAGQFAGSYQFWPSFYYRYDGVDGDNTQETTATNYTRIDICPSNPPKDPNDASVDACTQTTYPKYENRVDCAGTSCTYDEEIQNYANWYTYYRSRALMARGAIGYALSDLTGETRIGYASLNHRSGNSYTGITDCAVNMNSIACGVRPFSGTDKSKFYDLLYKTRVYASHGTHSPRALREVGDYFKVTNSTGPWSDQPGVSDPTETLEDQVTCRKNFAIVTTDGYWNNSHSYSATDDAIESAGPLIDGISRYSPVRPYKTAGSNTVNGSTLADVATYYWSNDLRGDMTNNVAATSENPAFWQHMVTYGVGFGVGGTISLPNDLVALTDGSKDWPLVTGTGETTDKIDDLLHATLNSRGEYFSADNPSSLADALSNALSSIAAQVASSTAGSTNTSSISTLTKLYRAEFNSSDWTGDILAYPINSDGSIGDIADGWKASDMLPDHADREIFTYGTSSGVEFIWGATGLDSVISNALNQDISGTVDNLGEARLNYLRGDTSNSSFRNRSTLIGDIVNSNPTYVEQGDFGYASGFSGLSTSEKSSYALWRATSDYVDRSNMLYFGANNGMMHGINADTGVELFAYVPRNAIVNTSGSSQDNISALTSPNYNHRYYVDANARVADANIGTGSPEWTSVLVSTLGGGGRGVFALDVGTPDSFGTDNVLWEINSAVKSSVDYLGSVTGDTAIGKTASGDWVAIVPNGYNSDTHTAALVVLDLTDGSVKQILDTKVGDASNPNGLSSVLAVDTNSDKLIDAVYAGDLQGNMWKFDLSANNSNSWEVAYGNSSTPESLYQACDGTCSSSTWRPITAKPRAIAHPHGGVMVLFGSGSFFRDDDITASRVEAMYGIWDNGAVVSPVNLQEQTIIYEKTASDVETSDGTSIYDIRTVSDTKVTYPSQKGWYLNVISPHSVDSSDNIILTGERIVDDIQVHKGRAIFTTIIPSSAECESGGDSWLMEIDPINGSRLNYNVIDVNGDGSVSGGDYINIAADGEDAIWVPASGRKSDQIESSPVIIEAADGSKEFKYISGTNGISTVVESTFDENSGRMSWRQVN